MDDLISRKAVMDGIADLMKSPWFLRGKDVDTEHIYPYPSEYVQYLERKEAVEIIRDLCIKASPAIDVKPVVHGRWIHEYGDPLMAPCSNCRYKVMRYNTTNYCPNCGAKMDGMKEE